MVNDGGLQSVLQTSDLVSNGLLSLNRSRAQQHNFTASAGAKRKPSRSLSEISGADPPIRMDLSQHTSAELKQVVEPLIKELENLDAAALLSLNPSKNGRGATLDPRQHLTVPPIHDRISPSYKNEGPNTVRFLHVKEVPHKYSVGVFIFPPHTQIPLHDHPDMVVLSRILYGELQVQSFDVLPGNDDSKIDRPDNPGHKRNCHDRKTSSTSRSSSALRTSFDKIKELMSRALSYQDESEDGDEDMQDSAVLHAKPNLNPMGAHFASPVDSDTLPMISAPNVTCLYPHEGNCHSFVAGANGAAVIDVLLPPYVDGERDCTFYEANEDRHGASANQQGQDEQASSYILAPMNQPEDFHCIAGSYGRFGACKEYCVDEREDNSGASCNLS
ncbi:hypothetical protein ACHAXR_010062 [Thalassiosira sp. AJA248-18]